MEKEVQRVITELEEKGWITVNKHLTREALAAVFVKLLQDMPLSTFIKTFNIFD